MFRNCQRKSWNRVKSPSKHTSDSRLFEFLVMHPQVLPPHPQLFLSNQDCEEVMKTLWFLKSCSKNVIVSSSSRITYLRFFRLTNDGMTSEKNSTPFLSILSWENLDIKEKKFIPRIKIKWTIQKQHTLLMTYFKFCKEWHFCMGGINGVRWCPSVSQSLKLNQMINEYTEHHISHTVNKIWNINRTNKNKPDGSQSTQREISVFRTHSVKKKRN